MTSDLLTCAEAAEIARVSSVTIRRRAHEGAFPAYRAGTRSVRIPRAEFLRWMFGDAEEARTDA